MDGYQATAKLRSDPRFAMLPIIAMTAHATIEERQRCLAAGMNDHVAKPIDPDGLFETVARFYKPAEAAAVPAATERPDPDGPGADGVPSIAGLDTRDGLSRVGGNSQLYLRLLRQFADQQGPSVEQITESLAEGDRAAAERLAHSLKGVAGNIGARQVHDAAGGLERLIRDGAAASDVDAAKRRVAAALQPLVTGLRGVLRPAAAERQAESVTATAADPARSRETAAQLSGLLAALDPGAADFVEANRATLRPLFDGATWPGFEKLIQDYAFADAATLLEQALARSRSVT
jgi:HPt (histidine-containing phosphotransfer) domain-containing protein